MSEGICPDRHEDFLYGRALCVTDHSMIYRCPVCESLYEWDRKDYPGEGLVSCCVVPLRG